MFIILCMFSLLRAIQSGFSAGVISNEQSVTITFLLFFVLNLKIFL